MKFTFSSKAKLAGVIAPLGLVTALVLSAGTITTEASYAGKAQGGLYAQHCSKCHGGDGKAQTAKGRKTNATDLTKSRVSDSRGIRVITSGGGEMPGYKSELSADEIRGLMNYVKGFRQ